MKKNLFLVLFFCLTALPISLFCMEQGNNQFIKKQEENQLIKKKKPVIKIITLEGRVTQFENNPIYQDILKQSKTINNLGFLFNSAINQDSEILLPDITKEQFDLIWPYLTDQKLDSIENLKKHSIKELAELLKASDYLETTKLYEQNCKTFAEKLISVKSLKEFINNSNYIKDFDLSDFLHKKIEINITNNNFDIKTILQLLKNIPYKQLYGPIGSVTCSIFSPDSKYLACGSLNVCLYDCPKKSCIKQFYDHKCWAKYLDFSPDGKFLASGSFDNTVCLYNCATKKLIRQFKNHSDSVNGITFSPDSKYLASTSRDKTVCLYDCKTLQKIAQFTNHTNWGEHLAFSPDSKYLASGSADKTVCIYNCESKTLVRQFYDHDFAVSQVTFSPDGNYFASASWEGMICLYNGKTLQKIAQFTKHTNTVEALIFSLDSKYFASASRDKTVGLYDLATKILIKQFNDHADEVNHLAFSPDNKFLASASEDKTVCLYDLATKILIKQLKDHQKGVSYLAFSSNGKYFASGSRDKTVCLYSLKLSKNLEQTLLLQVLLDATKEKPLDLNKPHLKQIFDSLDFSIKKELIEKDTIIFPNSKRSMLLQKMQEYAPLILPSFLRSKLNRGN